jgi:hypothetical protein
MYTEHIMYDLNEYGVEVGYDATTGMYVVCDANGCSEYLTESAALEEADSMIAAWATDGGRAS